MDSKDQDKIKRWFEGPSFLWNKTPCWSINEEQTKELSEEDPELKKVVKVNSIQMRNELLLREVAQTSSWTKLKRLLALLLMVKDLWMKRLPKIKSLNQLEELIKVQQVENAQEKTFKIVQTDAFADEINHLQSKNERHTKGRSINKLDPFLDEKGILRVGGRLQNSNLSKEENHPVILPKCSEVSKMIVRWSHQRVAHGARGMTLNHLSRSGMWIINANTLVHLYDQQMYWMP